MPDYPEVHTPYLSARSEAASDVANAASSLVNTTGTAVNIVNASRHFDLHAASLASRASNAADAAVPIGVMPDAAVLVSAWIVPHSSQAGSATNFFNARLIDFGTDGSGTAILASYSLSAAGQGIGALSAGAMTMSSSLSVPSGHVLGISYLSQGNGIAAVAHGVH